MSYLRVRFFATNFGLGNCRSTCEDKPWQTLKSRGIGAHFADNKLILHKPQSGEYQEPLHIVVGEQGEIDIAGRSLGRYQPVEKLAKKRELIGEIITFLICNRPSWVPFRGDCEEISLQAKP